MMKKNEIAVVEGFQLVGRYDGMDEETRALIEEDMDDLDDGGGIDCRRIKVPTGDSKAFLVEGDDPDDPDMMKEVEGVIIFHHKINTLWDGEYGGDNKIPACSSFDAKKGVRRDTGEICDCDHCKYNQFALNERGYNSKACKNMRRIYLMMSGSPYLYLLSVPPTSMKDLSRQLKKAMGDSKRPLSQTIVKFTLVKATAAGSGNTYNKIQVTPVGILDGALAAATTVLRNSVKEQYRSVAIVDDDYNVSSGGSPAADSDGFIDLPDADEELPFN